MRSGKCEVYWGLEELFIIRIITNFGSLNTSNFKKPLRLTREHEKKHVLSLLSRFFKSLKQERTCHAYRT